VAAAEVSLAGLVLSCVALELVASVESVTGAGDCVKPIAAAIDDRPILFEFVLLFVDALLFELAPAPWLLSVPVVATGAITVVPASTHL
jgi:hypothetical protein